MKRYTYTVMADNGVGEFLWQSHDSCLVGGNVYCLMDEGYEPPEMSPSLFSLLCAWARWYMYWEPRAYWPGTRKIDWDAFNREGMHLARELKRELSDRADVQYVRAWDDPD